MSKKFFLLNKRPQKNQKQLKKQIKRKRLDKAKKVSIYLNPIFFLRENLNNRETQVQWMQLLLIKLLTIQTNWHKIIRIRFLYHKKIFLTNKKHEAKTLRKTLKKINQMQLQRRKVDVKNLKKKIKIGSKRNFMS